MTKRLKNIKHKSTWIGAVLLSTFSVLVQYSLPIMSYGLIFAVIYCAARLMTKRTIIFNHSILIFTLWCIVSQLYIYIQSGTFTKNRNTYFFMFVAMFIIAIFGFIEKECFFKVYYIFGIIFSMLVIYQFIMANIFGILQSAIRILPVAEDDMHFWIQDSTRTAGVFTEPQAYCSYILPLLILLLSKKKIKSAIFISSAIFLSTSSQGIIIETIIWGYYLIIYEKNKRKKIFRCFIGGIFVVLALFILVRMPIFEQIINKILTINIFSYDIRLTKGFQIYFAMPLKDKLVGIGFGNLHDYLLNGKFDFFWMTLTRPELFAYITTMSNILVSFGILAFLLYLNIFFKNRNSATPEARLVLLVIFISSFTQTILFNAWYIFYWVIYEVFDEYDNSRYIQVSLGKEVNKAVKRKNERLRTKVSKNHFYRG